MGNFLVRYASRVVIYNRRAVIRLATETLIQNSTFEPSYWLKLELKPSAAVLGAQTNQMDYARQKWNSSSKITFGILKILKCLSLWLLQRDRFGRFMSKISYWTHQLIKMLMGFTFILSVWWTQNLIIFHQMKS